MSPAHRTDASAIGIWFAALAAIGFSFKAILVKLAYPYGVDATTLIALRMILALPFFLFVAVRERGNAERAPLSAKERMAIAALGITGYYGASYLDFLGLQYISAGLERLVLFLYPTMVVLLSWLFLGKPLSSRDALALAVSYVGIALAFAHDVKASPGTGDVWLGGALVFACAFCYAIYLIGNGQMVGKVGAARFTAHAMSWASVVCIVQFLLVHPLAKLALPWPVYALSGAMAVLSTVLPVFLVSAAIRRIGSGRTALIGSVGPLATIFLGYWLLDEPVSLQQLAGGALVMAGVLLVAR